jgi:hypothetical protein
MEVAGDDGAGVGDGGRRQGSRGQERIPGGLRTPAARERGAGVEGSGSEGTGDEGSAGEGASDFLGCIGPGRE